MIDGPGLRREAREALQLCVADARALQQRQPDPGGGDAALLHVASIAAVAHAAQQMLAREESGITRAYDAFLSAAADAEDVLCVYGQGKQETQVETLDAGQGSTRRHGGTAGSSVGSSTEVPQLADELQEARQPASNSLFHREMNFVATLATLSLSLRDVPVPDRASALKKEVGRINVEELQAPARALVDRRETSIPLRSASSICPAGISNTDAPQPVVFPLRQRFESGSISTRLYRIVRIVPEASQVLKSRERTPIMLHIEVVPEPAVGDEAADETDAAPVPANANAASTARASDVSTGCAENSSVSPAVIPNAAVAMESQRQCFGVTFQTERCDDKISAPLNHRSGGGSYAEPEPEPEPEISEMAFETTKDIEQWLRNESPYSGLRGWSIATLIVKSGDDIRQEQLAMQLIEEFDHIFKLSKLSLWLYPYRVIAVDPNAGVIEPVPSVLSIHALKERCVETVRARVCVCVCVPPCESHVSCACHLFKVSSRDTARFFCGKVWTGHQQR